MNNLKFLLLLCSSVIISCGSAQKTIDKPVQNTTKTYKILALGDSYTIGESVCETCRFPEQLKDNLLKKLNTDAQIDLKIIAKTGWTTTNLINTIAEENLNKEYDLVTLLIGVNNQFQHKSFSIYETEFPKLIDQAILFGKNDKTNLIIIFIPDYAFTTYGQSSSDPLQISSEIDAYNAFAKNYCEANNISFVSITDITRQGLNDQNLIASDGLHPSKKAYALFVERLEDLALEKIR